MPESKTAPKSDARDLARTKRADLLRDAQLAEEEQMKETIKAVEAKVATLNQPAAGVVVKGNQGRP
jgi:hypothetical protein